MASLLPWLLHAVLSVNAQLYPAVPLSEREAMAIAVAVDDLHGHYALSVAEGGYGRDAGYVRLAAELVVLAGTEGHFDPNARGRDAFGESFGLWQIHETTLDYLNATREDAFDLHRSAVFAARLIQKSHHVCARHTLDERLTWFSSGGPRCDVAEGLAASRHRQSLVEHLHRHHPPYWTDLCAVETGPRARAVHRLPATRFGSALARRRRRTASFGLACSGHSPVTHI